MRKYMLNMGSLKLAESRSELPSPLLCFGSALQFHSSEEVCVEYRKTLEHPKARGCW